MFISKTRLQEMEYSRAGSPIRRYPYMVHPVKEAGPDGKYTLRVADSGMTLCKTTNTDAVVKT